MCTVLASHEQTGVHAKTLPCTRKVQNTVDTNVWSRTQTRVHGHTKATWEGWRGEACGHVVVCVREVNVVHLCSTFHAAKLCV